MGSPGTGSRQEFGQHIVLPFLLLFPLHLWNKQPSPGRPPSRPHDPWESICWDTVKLGPGLHFAAPSYPSGNQGCWSLAPYILGSSRGFIQTGPPLAWIMPSVMLLLLPFPANEAWFRLPSRPCLTIFFCPTWLCHDIPTALAEGKLTKIQHLFLLPRQRSVYMQSSLCRTLGFCTILLFPTWTSFVRHIDIIVVFTLWITSMSFQGHLVGHNYWTDCLVFYLHKVEIPTVSNSEDKSMSFF